jgi:hypothetical protein
MGKMAIASLTRNATEAAASLPSTVMRFLDMIFAALLLSVFARIVVRPHARPYCQNCQ